MEKSIEKICSVLENAGGYYDTYSVLAYNELIAIYRALKYAKENGASFPNLNQLFNDYEDKVKRCEIVIDWESVELEEELKGFFKNENN